MCVAPRVALTMTQMAHRVPGGTASSVRQLATALAATGKVELTGVLARGDLRHPASMLHPPGHPVPRALPPGMRAATLPLPVPVLYDAWARTGRPTIGSSAGAVDLVHVTVPLRVGIGGLPMVATVHDLFPLTRPDELTRRGAHLMAEGLAWVLRSARAVMVPSRTVAVACREFGVDDDVLTVVPWGATPVQVDPACVDAVRRRHGLIGPYVLFVGTIEPRKNLAGLFAAMAALDRSDLTLVLVGPDGWGPDLEQAHAAVACPVARLGNVPASDLAPLYAGASVFCFPSFEEGFGLPVLEAMAAGAPVVTSAGTATADVASDAALLVDPHDTAAMAAALSTVLDDPQVAAELSERGRRRAAEHSWHTTAELTLDVYRRVLAR